MSVTLIQQPQEFHPAYNQSYFVINSTNKTQLGFRYVVGVFVGSTKIAEYKLRPVPATLYGEVDVAKVLQSQLDKDFRLLSTYNATRHFVNYRLQIDEEYFVNHPFTSALAASGSLLAPWPNFLNPTINPGGIVRAQLTSATEPPFSIGDLVNIQQDTVVNAAIEGIHTVLDKFFLGGVWYLVLDLPWSVTGASGTITTTGVIGYANGLKARFTGITSNTKTAWRGAFGFTSFPSYNAPDYLIDGVTKKLLTTLPNGVRISRNTVTKFACRKPSAARYAVFNFEGDLYRFQIASGTVVQFDGLPTNANIEQWYDGANWVTNPDNIDELVAQYASYELTLRTSALTVMSETYVISLYSECDFYDKYDITFLDRLGSWITIPFYKADAISTSVERQELRRKLPTTYTPLDYGMDSFHVEENLTYTVNSGQLSQTEYFYMRELLSTPKAFVSINGAPQQAINITSSNLDLLRSRTNKQRNLAIQFTMATQDEING
jgi:hypothetical protein